MQPRANHLAVIMDGNGRWAQQRNHSRVYGHVRGARVAKEVIEECCRIGLKNLTLFAFSTENWLRPKAEVAFLMGLLRRQLNKERQNLVRNNIRFHCIGNLNRLPVAVQEEVTKTIQATSQCSGMNLTFALSYGGRQEIISSVRDLARRALVGEINIDDIDEELFSNSLESSYLPSPDIILRTSGEQRISNFFLWQAAYSEIIISEKLWPEFNLGDLHSTFEEFEKRNRRFGQVGASPELVSPGTSL